jgi:hypothetical protein
VASGALRRAQAVDASPAGRAPPSGGERAEATQCAEPRQRRTSSQRAERWRAGIQCCMLLRNVVSIQRSWRVNVGGDIGDSNRWRGHRTVRFALCVQGRRDAGTASRLEPTLTVRLAFVPAAAATRVEAGDSGHFAASSGFRDTARVACDPDRIRRHRRAGAERELRVGEAARSERGGCHAGRAALADSRRRRECGHSRRLRGRRRQRREAVSFVAVKGASLDLRR